MLATDRYNFGRTGQTSATSSAYSPLSTSILEKGRAWKMRHLSNPEQPAYVMDRLSAVSNISMQILVSIAMAAVILVAASPTGSMPAGEGTAALMDAQTTGSIVGGTERTPAVRDDGGCSPFRPSGQGS
jgi:hypothetical protein